MSLFSRVRTIPSAIRTHPILSGAILLTLSGFVSRILGFFYRMYLSQQIGAEGMGVYQLIFPVFGVCFSLCCGSIQTAISRHVAAYPPKKVLRSGIALSFSLACLCAGIVYLGAPWIARNLLMESRCEPLLRTMAWTIPLCSLHSCLSGYYYGSRQAHIPAMAQLAEQGVRVLTVWLLCRWLMENRQVPSASTAVLGMLCGEAASLCVSAGYYLLHETRPRTLIRSSGTRFSTESPTESILFHPRPKTDYRHTASPNYLSQILSLAVPLTATRLGISLLQSAETILIPSRLQRYGLSASQALSIYGVLTGMAYPLILFPSAVIQSMAVMLLPDMANSQSQGDQTHIDQTTSRTITVSLYLGILCTGLFLFFGEDMGTSLFSDAQAGSYIVILSWLCPFLYLSTTLGSVLNGLGHTGITFLHHVLSLLSQLIFVLFMVPAIGIRGYLYGLLFGQLFLAALHLKTVRRLVTIHYRPFHHLLRPLGALGIAVFTAQKITGILPIPMISLPILRLGISCLTVTGLYFFFLLASRNHL